MAALKETKTEKKDSQRLARNDDQKFGQIVVCYERKQYDKGHKLAEEILKRNPDHGETEAMKGLLYNCQNNRTEAYNWVKQGLKHNIRSHVCWHVYGLIYRSDRNYKEAAKCYMNSQRINPNNLNLLRDLGYLQLQLRNYDGYVRTRREILNKKPSLRSNWVAAAMAHYHAKEYATTFDIISKGNEMETEGVADAEIGELLVLQMECLAKQGKYEEGLAHIDKVEKQVVHKLTVQQKRAEFLTCMGASRAEEAKKAWMALLEDEPENFQYHCGLQTVVLDLDPETSEKMFRLTALKLPCTELGLSEKQQADLLDLYNNTPELVADKYSKVAVRKIKFSLLEGDALLEQVETHIREGLSRGAPALYIDVCAAIMLPDAGEQGRKRPVKNVTAFKAHKITRALQDDYLPKQIASLTKGSTFAGESEVQPPTALLWALFLKCVLHEMSGELEDALLYANECQNHTPTGTDFFMKKARILKKMGNMEGAARVADDGRAHDLQDRYVNNKATRYLLRAGMMKEAQANMMLFARHEGDPQQYLHEMQTSWYELEAGEAWCIQRQFGQALKKFYSVQQHFSDYIEDMFDFHSFAVRKSTLRAHIDASGMQERVLGHPYFQRATEGALKVFLHLMDDPEDVDGLAHLNAKDRKKERERRKKQKVRDAKAEEDRNKKAAAEAEWMGSKAPDSGPKDADPHGDSYLTKNFGDEAFSWAQMLAPHYHRCTAEVLSLVAEVMTKKSKAVPALKALTVAVEMYPESACVHAALVKFAHRLCAPTNKSTKALSKNATVLALVRGRAAALLGRGACTRPEVLSYVEEQVNSLPCPLWGGIEGRIQLAKCVMLTKGEAGRETVASAVVPLSVMQRLITEDNVEHTTSTPSMGDKTGNASPRAFEYALARLTDARGTFKLGDEYKAEVRGYILARYPQASTFGVLREDDVEKPEDLDDMPGLESN
jgi:peptide alpha-N-acetyltransferase